MMTKSNNLISLALISLLVLGGLAAKKFMPPPAPPVEAVLVLDTTFKDNITRQSICRVIPAFSEEMRRNDSQTFYAMDNKITFEYKGAPMSATKAVALCRRLFEHPLSNTDLASALETLAQELASKGSPVCLILLTDGIDDGNDEVSKRITAAATLLARNPRIRRVAVLGTLRDERPHRKDFAALLEPLKAKLTVQPDISIETMRAAYRATYAKAR